jgi:hypothetical protein
MRAMADTRWYDFYPRENNIGAEAGRASCHAGDVAAACAEV